MTKEDELRIEKLGETMYFSPDEVLAFIRGASLENERLSAEIERLKKVLEQKTIALDSYYTLAAEAAPMKELINEMTALFDMVRSDLIEIHDDSPTGWTIIQLDNIIAKGQDIKMKFP